MPANDKFLSIVTPVYRSEASIDELVKLIVETLPGNMHYEIILVEDGSPDNSWIKIVDLCKYNDKVKGIKLSRNFGQHYAITAGLANSTGKYVVVMDCDLQHHPKYINDLVEAAERGYDIVYTSTGARKHNKFKNFVSMTFYKVFNLLTDSFGASPNVGSFSLLSRKAVDAFLQLNDFHRHYLLIVRLLGFNSTHVQIEHLPRKYGKSSYNLAKLIAHAIDGIVSQSNKLLMLIMSFGFFFVVLSFLSAAIIIYKYVQESFLPGWTSLIVVTLSCTGVILMSIGVLGMYVGKIFDQVKNRPLYFIDKKINL